MISPPAGCREELQRSPDLGLMTTAATKLFHRFLIGYLGFSIKEVFMGKRATSGEPCGPHTMSPCGRGNPRRHVGWELRGSPPSPFGLRVRDGKIGTWVFVPCNSENISCVTFLKRKTAENRKLALGILLIG